MIVEHEMVIETLCRLAAEQGSVSPAEVTLDTHFVTDLNYDSLDMVEFTMTVEDTFDVDVPDEKVESVHTVRDAYAMLLELMAPAPSNG